MTRMPQHLFHCPAFDDPAGIHDGNCIGKACNDLQVMRDPDKGGSGVAAQLLHLVQYLALDGDIQRCGWLVANDEVRLVDHCDRNRDALAHSA
jgi:hypothetical protein